MYYFYCERIYVDIFTFNLVFSSFRREKDPILLSTTTLLNSLFVSICSFVLHVSYSFSVSISLYIVCVYTCVSVFIRKVLLVSCYFTLFLSLFRISAWSVDTIYDFCSYSFVCFRGSLSPWHSIICVSVAVVVILIRLVIFNSYLGLTLHRITIIQDEMENSDTNEIKGRNNNTHTHVKLRWPTRAPISNWKRPSRTHTEKKNTPTTQNVTTPM